MKTRILALTAIAVFALTAAAVAKTNTFSVDLKRADFKDGKAGTATFKVKTDKRGVASKK